MKRLVLVLSVFLFSCDDDEDQQYVQPDLNGEWVITGEGKQTDCDKQLENYRYDIRIDTGWTISMLEAGEFSEENPVFDLQLESEHDGLQDFSGELRDTYLEFEFVDALGEEEITYVFKGRGVGTRKVKGDFSASGPGSCQTSFDSSSFTLEVLSAS